MEFSFDEVFAKTTRAELANPDGTPRTAHFFVLEGELDHLQLVTKSGNQYLAAGVTTSQPLSTDSEQDRWLAAASAGVTLDTEPRLHDLKDLESPEFRSTESYQLFEEISEQLVPKLFPSGLGSGRQKSALAAERMGLAFYTDAELSKGIEKAYLESGYTWSPEMKAAFDKSIQDASTKTAIINALTTQRAAPIATLNTLASGVTPAFDPATLKVRLRSVLGALGFKAGTEIDALADGIAKGSVNSRQLENTLQYLSSQQDKQVASTLAALVPGATVPTLTPDPDALVMRSATGLRAAQALVDLGVEPADVDALKTALVKSAVSDGKTMYQVRTALVGLGNNVNGTRPQSALTGLFSGNPPVLHMTAAKAISLASPSFAQQFIQFDDSFKKVITALVKDKTYDQAIQTVQNLGYTSLTVTVGAQARKLGLPEPKPTVDGAALDAAAVGAFGLQGVEYNAEMQKFMRDVLGVGVPANRLLNQLRYIFDTGDLQVGLANQNIFVSGLTYPKIKYDLTAIENNVLNSVSSNQFASLVDRGPRLQKYIQDLISQGLGPSTISTFTSYFLSYGAQQAAQYLNGSTPDVSTLELPWDRAGIRKWLETTLKDKAKNTEWSGALAAYVDQTLPALMKSPTFNPGNLQSVSSGAGLAAQLSQMSGVPVPPELSSRNGVI